MTVRALHQLLQDLVRVHNLVVATHHQMRSMFDDILAIADGNPATKFKHEAPPDPMRGKRRMMHRAVRDEEDEIDDEVPLNDDDDATQPSATQ